MLSDDILQRAAIGELAALVELDGQGLLLGGAESPEVTELEDSTLLFERYEEQLRLSRVYVPPDAVARAGALIDRLV